MTEPVRDSAEGLLALVLRADAPLPEGVRFWTPPSEPLQLATMRLPPGHRVAPHVHLPCRREVERTQELLLVRRGTVEVTFYSLAGEPAGVKLLSRGDCVLILGGGHGLRVMGEEAEVLECKSGPYLGRDRDKAALGVEP